MRKNFVNALRKLKSLICDFLDASIHGVIKEVGDGFVARKLGCLKSCLDE